LERWDKNIDVAAPSISSLMNSMVGDIKHFHLIHVNRKPALWDEIIHTSWIPQRHRNFVNFGWCPNRRYHRPVQQPRNHIQLFPPTMRRVLWYHTYPEQRPSL
jgi:hypothetical protein